MDEEELCTRSGPELLWSNVPGKRVQHGGGWHMTHPTTQPCMGAVNMKALLWIRCSHKLVSDSRHWR
eukprot:jgi/Mesvir1/4853/Mv25257-RA.1